MVGTPLRVGLEQNPWYQSRTQISTKLYAVADVCSHPAPATQKGPQTRAFRLQSRRRKADFAPLFAPASISRASIRVVSGTRTAQLLAPLGRSRTKTAWRTTRGETQLESFWWLPSMRRPQMPHRTRPRSG
jgi:hypothetical protein